MTTRFNKSGFTLMELVLVLVVLSVCTLIAAPSLRGFTRSRRLPNAAQEMMNIARWCRVQAITEGTTYRLNLDEEKGRYWITKDDGTGNYVQVSDPFIQNETKLPEGIQMTSTIAPVEPGDE